MNRCVASGRVTIKPLHLRTALAIREGTGATEHIARRGNGSTNGMWRDLMMERAHKEIWGKAVNYEALGKKGKKYEAKDHAFAIEVCTRDAEKKEKQRKEKEKKNKNKKKKKKKKPKPIAKKKKSSN